MGTEATALALCCLASSAPAQPLAEGLRARRVGQHRREMACRQRRLQDQATTAAFGPSQTCRSRISFS